MLLTTEEVSDFDLSGFWSKSTELLGFDACHFQRRQFILDYEKNSSREKNLGLLLELLDFESDPVYSRWESKQAYRILQ